MNNDINTQSGIDSTVAHSAETSQTAGNGANVFTQVFSALGDHYGFYIADYHICDLPYIIWDAGDLHFYSNEETLTEGGLFKEVEHKVVRQSDGTAPELDLSITNLVAFQWIAMIFIFAVFNRISRKKVCRPDKPPHTVFLQMQQNE